MNLARPGRWPGRWRISLPWTWWASGWQPNQLTLTAGYDIENLRDPERRKRYHGAVTTDRYGRQIPKHAHGTVNLEEYTASSKRITAAILELFDRVVDKSLLIRRMYVTANRVTAEDSIPKEPAMEQLDLFTDYEAAQAKKEAEAAELAREKKLQETMLGIKRKYGKNAILKWTNLIDGATAADRNNRIGGTKNLNFKIFCEILLALLYLYQEAKMIKGLKCVKKKVKGLTKDAVTAIMGEPDLKTKTGRRDLTLLMLLYGTAARIGEVLSLRVGSLHLNTPKPYVNLYGKGCKMRTAYLLPRITK